MFKLYISDKEVFEEMEIDFASGTYVKVDDNNYIVNDDFIIITSIERLSRDMSVELRELNINLL